MSNHRGPERAASAGPRVERGGSVESSRGWRSSIHSYLFEKHIAYLLIMPTLVSVLLVNVYPLVYTFVLSFQEYKLSSAAGRWIGLARTLSIPVVSMRAAVYLVRS